MIIFYISKQKQKNSTQVQTNSSQVTQTRTCHLVLSSIPSTCKSQKFLNYSALLLITYSNILIKLH